MPLSGSNSGLYYAYTEHPVMPTNDESAFRHLRQKLPPENDPNHQNVLQQYISQMFTVGNPQNGGGGWQHYETRDFTRLDPVSGVIFEWRRALYFKRDQ